MIAQEIFHALITNLRGRNKWMVIKTDMSKAYDQVKLNFIKFIMQKTTWIDWIIRCITSFQYHVLMNCQHKGNILPKRGLRRQGDPLSYFLSILCTKTLVNLLNHTENQENIAGCVSHVLAIWCHTFFSLMT